MKLTQITERVGVKYSFDIYNLTNHPSFDIPIDNVDQNLSFSTFPIAGVTGFADRLHRQLPERRILFLPHGPRADRPHHRQLAADSDVAERAVLKTEKLPNEARNMFIQSELEKRGLELPGFRP